MGIKNRLDKLEKASFTSDEISVICLTNPEKDEMSIGPPVNFRGTIEQCKDLISKRNLSIVNLIRGNPSRAI